MSIVTITDEPLALEDLLAVVDGARVELADSTRAVIAASRAVVDRALSSNKAVYGLDACVQQMTTLPPTTLYGLRLRYPAAAVFPELKQLAAPATLDTPPLDLGVEDHHTAAPLSVRKTDAALGLLEDLLAIELMLARDMLATAPSKHALGAGTDAALRLVEEAITAADPQPDAVHRALRERFPVRRVGASVATGQSAAP
jgi:histidine ammonia-lyase